MDPTAASGNVTGGSPAAGAASSAAPATPQISPEAQAQIDALQRQLREEARRRGSTEAELRTLRREQAEAAAAAQAQAAADQAAAFAEALGEEGVTFWNELSELSVTDPVAAAKKLADWRKSAAASITPVPSSQPPSGTAVNNPAPTGQPVPPPPAGVPADGSLSNQPTADPDEVEAAASEQRFNEIVGRIQDPKTRNRVRRAEREEGLYHYLNAAYRKALVKMRRPPAS